MNSFCEKVYRRLALKTDPRVCLRMPKDVYQDLELLAERNGRSRNAEIIARLIATLQNNDQFMSHDILMQLISNKRLAFENRTKIKKDKN